MANHIIWQDRKRLWCGLPWTFTVYSLSEDRLFIKTGFLSVKEDVWILSVFAQMYFFAFFISRLTGCR